MRAIVTGQVGVDKGPYLRAVQDHAKAAGIDRKTFHRLINKYALK